MDGEDAEGKPQRSAYEAEIAAADPAAVLGKATKRGDLEVEVLYGLLYGEDAEGKPQRSAYEAEIAAADPVAVLGKAVKRGDLEVEVLYGLLYGEEVEKYILDIRTDRGGDGRYG